MWLARTGIIAGSKPLSTLNTNLFAYYKAENNANDSLGTYNGTAMGGLTYVAGKSGDAFGGNGTNAYVSLPDNMFKFTGDFSFSFWVKSNAQSTDVIISTMDSALTRGWYVYHSGAGKLRFYQFNSNGNQYVEFSTTLSSATWKHYTFVKQLGAQAVCYENGTLASVNATSGNTLLHPTYAATQSSTLLARKYSSVINYCNYNLDEVGIWNKAINSTEVTELQSKFYPF